MIIVEGRALQDQNDVEEQVKQEDRQKRGRKSRNETKRRRCGVCGKTGHNARTCEIAMETSIEEDSSEDQFIFYVVVVFWVQFLWEGRVRWPAYYAPKLFILLLIYASQLDVIISYYYYYVYWEKPDHRWRT